MVLVACEIVFQCVSGFSEDVFFIGIFISSYNLVLSTLQSLAAIMLEHRKLSDPLPMVSPLTYVANLQNSKRESRVFWGWITKGFLHGIIITVVTLFTVDSLSEADPRDGHALMKYIGVKDQSTLVFNIILHVIFIKLTFELD